MFTLTVFFLVNANSQATGILHPAVVEAMAVPTSYADEFLIAVQVKQETNEELPHSAMLLIATISSIPVMISISCPRCPGDSLLHGAVTVTKHSTAEFIILDKYFSKRENGRKWCFHVTGSGSFSLSVHVKKSNASIANYLAIPVKAWGRRYILFNLEYNPSVQIFSSENDNLVSMKLTLSINSKFVVEGVDYYENDTIQFWLDRFEALSISECSSDHILQTSMFGTIVKGYKPIGVISGNCEVISSANLTDLTGEMLPPLDATGTQFVVFTFPTRKTKISLHIIAFQYASIIGFSPDVHPLIFLEKERKLMIKKSFEKNVRVSSNYPIMLMSYHDTTLLETKGSLSMSMVVPENLYCAAYSWRKVESVYNQFVAFVTDSPMHTLTLRLNSHPLSSIHLTHRAFDFEFLRREIVHIQLFNESYHAWSVDTHFGKERIDSGVFGCYIYGYTEQTAYMNTVGFQRCGSIAYPGDGLDNDCDGEVDEDHYFSNGSGFGKDHEDFAKPPPVNGGWGTWGHWICDDENYVKYVYRKRMCNNPTPAYEGRSCIGDYQQQMPVVCHRAAFRESVKTFHSEMDISKNYKEITATYVLVVVMALVQPLSIMILLFCRDNSNRRRRAIDSSEQSSGSSGVSYVSRAGAISPERSGASSVTSESQV